jgi:DsbC/DsbD-like thiol-disulfide interchange protein
MIKNVLVVQAASVLFAVMAIVGFARGSGPGDGGGVRGEGPDGDDLAKMSLIFGRTAIIQRAQEYIGVNFEIEKGWHLYWRHPGESGGPIEVTVDAPEGVEVGYEGQTILWPTPKRLVENGSVTYVYEGRATLILPVRVTERFKPGDKVKIKAKASWVVCRESCKFGEGEAEIELPVVASRAEAPDSSHYSLLAQARTRLPSAIPPGGKMLDINWEGTSLVLSCEGAQEMRFFPYEPADTHPLNMAEAGASNGPKLVIPYPSEIRTAKRVRGVLEMKRGPVQWFLNIDVAPPKGE